MPTEKTIQLFTYDELSSTAKETAKDWWLRLLDESDYEAVTDDFIQCASLIGVEVATRLRTTMGGQQRPFPEVRYSLSYSQGDGAAFSGSYTYTKGGTKAIRKHAPQDATLHRIADELAAIQKRYGYRITATMSDGHLSNFYTHSGTMAVDIDADNGAGEKLPTEEDEKAIRGLIRRLADWYYARLMEEDAYLRSDEQIADTMAANGYTFRENGKRED